MRRLFELKEKKVKKNDNRKRNATFEQVVMELCKQYNLKCKVSESIIFITTNIGNWRLICKGNVIKVYHNNHNPDMGVFLKRHGKFNEGFHSQTQIQTQIQTNNIREAIEYIYNHDKSYLNAGYFINVNIKHRKK